MDSVASGITGRGPNRGVAFWTEGNEKRVFAAVLNWVYALDGATGKPIPSVSTNGRIDLLSGPGCAVRLSGVQSSRRSGSVPYFLVLWC